MHLLRIIKQKNLLSKTVAAQRPLLRQLQLTLNGHYLTITKRKYAGTE